MTSQTTRGHKRKLADNNSGPSPSREPSSSVVEAEVKSLIQTVRDLSSRPVEKIDRAALRKAAHALADYCKTGTSNTPSRVMSRMFAAEQQQ